MKSPFNILVEKIQTIFKPQEFKFSLIAIFLIIASSTILLAVNMTGTTYKYKVGDIAKEDIKVARDIEYVNENETDKIRKKGSEEVPLVFDKDASVLRERINIINNLCNYISNTLKQFPPTGTDMTFQVYAMKSVMPKYLHYNDTILLELLKFRDIDRLRNSLVQILIYIYNDEEMGILERPYDNPLKVTNSIAAVRTINSPGEVAEYSRPVENLKTLDDINNRLYTICYSLATYLPKTTLTAVTQIIRRNLHPNIVFNIDESRRRINEKLKEITPVKGKLKKGQTIVRDGDTITADILEKIEIHNRHTTKIDFSSISGIFIIQIIFFLIFGYFLLEFKRILLPDKKSIIIIFSLIFFFMIYTFLLSRVETPFDSKMAFAFLLPIPFVTMIMSILYNTSLSMMVGIYIIFFTSMITGGDISIIFISFSAALLGVFVNENVEKRTDFLRGGSIIGITNVSLILAISLMQELPILNMNLVKIMGVAFASGIINSILALGILPIYENLFGITTKFKLLELSDLNADIFKDMLLKAPGTYNHSLIVSTMAETACKDITANHLLARVGSYYHDIGKVPDSGMYIENRVTDPRAKYMSSKGYAQLIISHVEKGEKIAKKISLPDDIISFIREHHGRTTMTFFYHQSLESADSDEHEHVDKSDFQYPGPKPHNKEAAVVMLADAIEAASRSLEKPTYEKLEGLVRKIIYNKLNEGELEFSDLSMSELNSIQESFLKILNGIFHTRIEYPEDFDIRKLEQRKKKANGTN